MENKQIKSKKRVRDLGEVYTNQREIDAMLDLVKPAFDTYNSKFFEPACGNGNFLVSILNRKLDVIDFLSLKGHKRDFAILQSIASIYAIDINRDNVIESRCRLFNIVNNRYDLSDEFSYILKWVLKRNIIVGDSINKDYDIIFMEYLFNDEDLTFSGKEFRIWDEYLENKRFDEIYTKGRKLTSIKERYYLEKRC